MHVNSLIAPSDNAQAVTKSDTDTFPPTKAVYVGATGDVTVTMQGGMQAEFESVPAGTILPIRCTQILSTGTEASKFTILY